MEKVLCVLMVEDSDEDAALILRQLQKTGYTIEHTRVETALEMRAVLQERQWDLITSDYLLAKFDAHSALYLLQQSGLDIPFIVISGEITDETAVALMRAGAHDYLKKDNLARLTPVLERELVQMRHRQEYLQSQTSLRESNEKFQLLVERSASGILVLDKDGLIIEWNHAQESIYGMTRAEVLGKTGWEVQYSFLPADTKTPQDLQLLKTSILGFLRTGQPKELNQKREFPIYRPDGVRRWIEARAFVYITSEGNISVTTSEDITDQKRVISDLSRRNQEMNLLYEASLELVRTLDIESLLETLFQKISKIMDCHSFFIAAFDEQTQMIRCLFGKQEGIALDVTKLPEIPLEPEGHGIQSQVIRSGKPLLINDYLAALSNTSSKHYVTVESEVEEYEAVSEDEVQTRAGMILPLLFKSRVMGTIQILSYRLNAYSETDLNIAEALVAQFAVAYNNAILYREAQEEIAERSRAESALRRSEESHREILQMAMDGFWKIDMQGNLLDVNDAYCRMSGYTRQELLEMRVSDMEIAESEEETAGHIRKIFNTGFDRFESRQRRKDGSIFDVEVSVQYQKRDGDFMVSFIEDITHRKQVTDALRESELRLKMLFELLPVGVSVINKERKVVYMNPAQQKIMDISDAALMKAVFAERRFLRPDGTPMEPDEFASEQAIRGQQAVSNIETGYIKHKDNPEVIWSSISAMPVSFSDWLVIIVSIDITEQKQAESELLRAHMELEQRVVDRTRELQAANVALEKAARLKDEFLASMSHELRTPLTGILGLSEALQMVTYGEVNEKQLRALRNIEVSGRHLLALINDMLDLSKIEAGKVDLQFETCSLNEICQSSLQLTKGLVHQKHQNVSFHMAPATIYLRADARRVKQMLVNLIGNAIKFTPDGGKLGLDVVGDTEKQEVRITIWDEGIGIREEDIPRLFQPFVQLDSGLTRQYSGTGLGLSLVRRLVGLHGGQVIVESIFGKGSQFTIVLPWLEITRNKSRDTGLVTRPLVWSSVVNEIGPMVLLVDDNEQILSMVSDFLVSQNYRVSLCQGGLELFKRLELVQPDIILMDIQMPDIDGFNLIRRIRSNPLLRISSVPIIAVTALAMDGDRERCLDAGANAYLSKPIQLRNLLEVIERIRPLTS